MILETPTCPQQTSKNGGRFLWYRVHQCYSYYYIYDHHRTILLQIIRKDFNCLALDNELSPYALYTQVHIRKIA